MAWKMMVKQLLSGQQTEHKKVNGLGHLLEVWLLRWWTFPCNRKQKEKGQPSQSATLKVKKKCPSKGDAVVSEVTQGVCDQPMPLCFSDHLVRMERYW